MNALLGVGNPALGALHLALGSVLAGTLLVSMLAGGWPSGPSRRFAPLVRALSLAFAASGVAALALGRAGFGALDLVRLASFAIAGALAFALGRSQRPGRALACRAAIAGAAMAGTSAQAWTWLASAPPGGAWTVAVGVASLGVWIGALPAALAVRARADASDSPPAPVDAKLSALAVALLLVALVTLAPRAWAVAGGIPDLLGTRYGRLHLLTGSLLLAALIANAIRMGRPANGRLLAAAIDVPLALAVLIAGALAATASRTESPEWPFSVRLAPQVTWSFPGVQSGVMTGAAYFAVGILASIGSWRSKTWRPVLLAVAAVLLPWGAYAALSPMTIDAYPTTYARSPVRYEAASVASGRRLFAEHCAACHGTGGRGDGPAADSLLQRPADLTSPHTADHTPGDIYWWITNGLGLVMPPFGDRLTAVERWALVSFVRALGAGERARALTEEVGARDDVKIVAPDFGFVAGPVAGRLSDDRGRRPVLLVLFTPGTSSARLQELALARANLSREGVAILAVPLRAADGAGLLGANKGLDGLPIVTQGAADIAAAYELLARTRLPADALPNPPPPSHAEFLVDKSGHLRGRWIRAEELPGWGDLAALTAQIRTLARETPSTPGTDALR